jgi:hypothetical protein
VRVSDARVLERVIDRLPPRSRAVGTPTVDELYSLVVGGDTAGPVRRYHVLYAGAARLARSLELSDVLETLALDLEDAVAHAARRALFVEAGVVGWRGRALVLLGPPGSGTTTLVDALVRAGATYYSDRYAVLDARGRVHAYPTPLRATFHASPAADAPLPRPPVALPRALPVGAIVAVRYEPDVRWRACGITRAQAIVELLVRSASSARRPAFALRVLDAALADARALRGERGEASEAVAALLDTTTRGTSRVPLTAHGIS